MIYIRLFFNNEIFCKKKNFRKKVEKKDKLTSEQKGKI